MEGRKVAFIILSCSEDWQIDDPVFEHTRKKFYERQKFLFHVLIAIYSFSVVDNAIFYVYAACLDDWGASKNMMYLVQRLHYPYDAWSLFVIPETFESLYWS